MSPHNQPLFSKAAALPPIERAELVELLLSTFERKSRKKHAMLWAHEAESRIDAFERGKLKAFLAEDVFKNIEKRHK